VINPSTSEANGADLSFIVAGSKDAIVMVEGGADQVSEDEVVEALFFAHKEMQPLIEMQNELAVQCNTRKTTFVVPSIVDSISAKSGISEGVVESLRRSIRSELGRAVQVSEKAARRDSIRAVRETAQTKFFESLANIDGSNKDALLDQSVSLNQDVALKVFNKIFEDEVFESVRSLAFDKKLRLDGRDFTTVRPISIELGFLPRTHGSSLFTRGETQAIVVTTLGTEQEAQKLDNLVGETEKTFLLHYNFPGYSVGEVKPLRGPGRREIGHGALAERAIKAVIPSAKEFPYVIRVVSEITESNGSSSMATVCGASLALMDAGVPIKAPVAGVAMGLMVRGSDEFVVLTDILGDEDHLGDMDFKVCGTSLGITALQMDIKIKGLAKAVVEVALNQAKTARLHILAKMSEVVNVPRSSLSKYAPRIETIRIPVDKIREVIGPGGKTIRSITESCGVKIDIGDDGIVRIASSSETGINEARSIIENLTKEAEVGKLYRGVVKRIVDFGAFVEIIPGTEGLVHISQLEEGRVNRVSDVIQEGESIWVKVLEIDRPTGKIRLSRKEALVEVEKQGL
jgi:polyribonucleotide nucleotidyltransferase